MICSEKKLEMFLSSILELGEQKAQEINAEIDKLISEEEQRCEKEAIKEAYAYTQREQAICSDKIQKEYSQKEAALKMGVYQKRKDITDTVFNEAKKKLLSFSKTEEYKNVLIKSAKNVANKFPNTAFTIFLREEDLTFSRELSDILGKDTKTEATNSISLGGMRVKLENRGIIIDLSFDTALNDELESFINISELRLS